MSYKLQFKYHYLNLVKSIQSVSAPNWLGGLYMRVGLIMFIGIFGVLYLMQTGNTAVAGYEIHKLENRVSELSQEISKTEDQIADLRSMVSIKGRVPALKMHTISSLKHLTSAGASVAKR